MTLGLSHDCKLWLRLSKGMLPVKHVVQKILIAVNYCGRLLPQRLGFLASAYHEMEAAILHANIVCSMMGDLMGALVCW